MMEYSRHKQICSFFTKIYYIYTLIIKTHVSLADAWVFLFVKRKDNEKKSFAVL